MKLIVEMEMPICCADCPCCICLNGMKPAYCKAVMVDDDNIVDGLMWRETDPNERPSWCPIKGEISDIELMHLEEERAFAARNIAAESEADADYQLSVLMQEYFERYEPTYNSEDGSM